VNSAQYTYFYVFFGHCCFWRLSPGHVQIHDRVRWHSLLSSLYRYHRRTFEEIEQTCRKSRMKAFGSILRSCALTLEGQVIHFKSACKHVKPSYLDVACVRPVLSVKNDRMLFQKITSSCSFETFDSNGLFFSWHSLHASFSSLFCFPLVLLQLRTPYGLPYKKYTPKLSRGKTVCCTSSAG
jgi:hypothetical protein